MYFDGCASHLGCTVTLRGGGEQELRKVNLLPALTRNLGIYCDVPGSPCFSGSSVRSVLLFFKFFVASYHVTIHCDVLDKWQPSVTGCNPLQHFQNSVGKTCHQGLVRLHSRCLILHLQIELQSNKISNSYFLRHRTPFRLKSNSVTNSYPCGANLTELLIYLHNYKQI